MIGEAAHVQAVDLEADAGAKAGSVKPMVAEKVDEEMAAGPVGAGGKKLEDEEDGDDKRKSAFPMRTLGFDLPHGGSLSFNPLVSLLGGGLLWGLAIWCMVQPESSLDTLNEWTAWAVKNFSWFFVGVPAFLAFFLLYIFVVYGHQKLAKDQDAQPEFGDVAFFCMLFSAGVAVGLFFFGVSEPLYHLADTRFDTGFKSQDEAAQYAINVTLFHWGLIAWVVYVSVGLALGLASHRDGLPLTIRSTLFPLLGGHTWGWIGDLVDSFTIVTVVAGVCTSLGLGVSSIVTGLQNVDVLPGNLNEDEITNAQVVTIWVITLVATISVVSGLDAGIKTLSYLAFVLGCILLFMVLVLGNTPFLLNLIVQSTGYYLQYTLELTFATDAFGQLTAGDGRALDNRGAAAWWMGSWTVFYWAWWVSWSSFVGVFLARISKGRTIRNVMVFSLILPTCYCILWFCIFGGNGLWMARRAQELVQLGTAQGDPALYQTEDRADCFNPPADPITVSVSNPINPDEEIEWTYENQYPWITPVCLFAGEQSWYDALYQFNPYGGTLSTLSLIAIAIYFVTSSDSGSLVVDHLASNGVEETHYIQRIFWAFTEGALATGLLVSGGANALRALQAASILCGLPFTAILCMMVTAISRMCQDYERPNNQREFELYLFGGVWNIFETILSFGVWKNDERQEAMPFPTQRIWINFAKSLFLPSWTLYEALNARNPSKKVFNISMTVVHAFFFVSWIAIWGASGQKEGLYAFGWLAFILNAFGTAALRMTTRHSGNIRGNVLEDLACATFFYPNCLEQIRLELEAQSVDDETTKLD
ncbi:Glycine betaine transporter [Durusdinium trenchii]|uniref:Glycine betaine transporter n=1 Tax=Durusdinium trenchii TaxID=1381693 RepID=A0ABP0IE15_9DINO